MVFSLGILIIPVILIGVVLVIVGVVIASQQNKGPAIPPYAMSMSQPKPQPQQEPQQEPQPQPAPQPMQYTAPEERKLVATGGQYKGAQFTIGESILMGCSGAQCHVIFGADVSGVSDVQCEVKCENGIVSLTDKAGSYSTMVNDERMLRENETMELNVGDTFRLGENETFMIQ